MSTALIVCARCTTGNLSSNRFCVRCDLPLGGVQADVSAGQDVLGLYEAPDLNEPDGDRVLKEFVQRSKFEASPFGFGWRLVVPLHLDRKQAVYVALTGVDPEGRPVLSLISVCGPANERDTRALLKLNAHMVEGHFAIKILRGEEYFVVVANLPAQSVASTDTAALVLRVARLADGLEDRLSRGRDIY